MERVKPNDIASVRAGFKEYARKFPLMELTTEEKYELELCRLRHRQAMERAKKINFILGVSMKPLNPKTMALLGVKHFREEMHLDLKYSESGKAKIALVKLVVWALCPTMSLGIRLRYAGKH
ncbi:MAG: hypothetical protein Q7S53_04895 [bacterium]|nr:hypothetical protein [bacterium]